MPARKALRILLALGILAGGGLHIARSQGTFFDAKTASGGSSTSIYTNDRVHFAEPIATPPTTASAPQSVDVEDLGIRCVNGDDSVCEEARRLALSGCMKDEPGLCDEMSYFLFAGTAGEADHARALVGAKRGCEKGNGRACNNAGVILRDSDTVQNVEGASEFFVSACGKGFGDGCFNEHLYRQKESKHPKLDQALLEKSCTVDIPNAVGCRWAAMALADGKDGVTKNLDRAIEFGTRGCELKDAASCNNLGLDLGATGENALSAFMQGCELASGNSCQSAGEILFFAKGVAADQVRARSHFEIACEKEVALGCRNLGAMAFEGQGGPKDLEAAVAAKIKSCDLGDANVCLNLADLWWEGDEVAKDREGAKRALARACELGEERGCKPPK